MTQQKRIEQFFNSVGVCNEVQHLHHLYDPHIAGIYGIYNNKMIGDNTLPAINKAFVHNPAHQLLASSENGIDLIYIPTIYRSFDSRKQCLTEKEIVVISDLKIACNDLNSLLNFHLDEKFTIRTRLMYCCK